MTNDEILQAMVRRATRRRFLQRAGVLGAGALALPGLLAGCGDDEEGGSAATAEKTAGPAEVPAASGRLDYLSWEGYDIPDAMKAWRKANNIEIKTNYIANHDDIQAKIKAGGSAGGFDIITYYQGYKPLYAQLEILKPIDESKLPEPGQPGRVLGRGPRQLLGRPGRHAHGRALDLDAARDQL